MPDELRHRGAPGIPRAELRSAPSSHLDLAPTLLALAGVDARGIGEDGESLVPVFEGGWLERRERFLELHPRIDACVYNHFIVTDRWRLTLYPNGEREWGELFNLEVDPGEHENLFHDPAHRAVRDRLGERLVLRFPPDPNGGTALIAKW